ncbi:MAG: hypothetical protein HYX44_14330, partial [Aquabacterium sp.]|nr:hypothetical protein [Aquabacterium sp.]
MLSTQHLGWWALQFTPRVALLEDAVVLEVQASERLFGGAFALRERIVAEASAHGALAHAHAITALAAVALARHGATATAPLAPPAHVVAQGAHQALRASHEGDEDDGCVHELNGLAQLSVSLDTLPLHVLPGVATHSHTLARLGCRTLADVRALPRGGLSRRFGSGLLQTLDRAYGRSPEAFPSKPCHARRVARGGGFVFDDDDTDSCQPFLSRFFAFKRFVMGS